MLATDWRLRAAVITAIAFVVLVVVVLVGGGNSVVDMEAFAQDVQRLTTEANADLGRIVSTEIERRCAVGEADACAQHARNASVAAVRIEDLFASLAQLPLPGEARGWADAYVEALSALQDGWLAQADALASDERPLFEEARVATIEASVREEQLRFQFERDYAGVLTAHE